MADTLDRINKLIALALNNPNEEEARSAAMAAVKSIRENSIVLSEKPTAPTFTTPTFQRPAYYPYAGAQPPPYQPPTSEDYQRQADAFREMFEQWSKQNR